MEFQNFYICIVGWLAWNIGLFSFTKDEYDDLGKPFPVKEYFYQHYDNWLASLFAIPVLLVVGKYQLGFDALAAVDLGHLKWSTAYFLGSGFFTEAGKYSYKKWRKKKLTE